MFYTINNHLYKKNNAFVGSAHIDFTRHLNLVQVVGGTISANKLTGYAGDQVTLSLTKDNEYWHTNGYSLTGEGSIQGNTFTFGEGDAYIQGNFLTNAITARGVWRNEPYGISVTSQTLTARQTEFREAQVVTAITGNVPTGWSAYYDDTTNFWQPHYASGYRLEIHPTINIKASGARNGCIESADVGLAWHNDYEPFSTSSNSGGNGTFDWNYNNNFVYTADAIGGAGPNLGVSGHIYARGVTGRDFLGNIEYFKAATWVPNGTIGGYWVATGFAPNS